METDVPFTLGKRNSATLFNKDDKPIEHILAIKHALMPYGKKCSFPAGKKIRLFHNGIRHWFLLQSGEMSACRDSDGLKIANFREPSLAGIAETFFPKELIFFLAESPVELVMYQESDVLETLARENLWQNLVHIQAYVIQALSIRDRLLSGNDAYEVVCNHLLMLMNEKEAFRLSTTVPRYIQQRTQLSRSGIMKILSDLRKGDYITVEKGILLAVNRLPKRY
ncbi:putative DNA-binding transcriptional regulator [Serratia liquefaciens]|uniref:winged helix-turn-helix transcriptional regulator n=1 Tax=Serratia TaxID=613 RepID=UPI0003583B06|nr:MULTISPECIES: winged helix-turn-helix transcriptional regulator [Serratia]AGQ32504.1 hypothetical protein M495_19285 [Serratia liquefaciens ATCC 27592]CAI0695710.1 putative DNA-binding transcriptional regulator [Serratia liquefaciens]CAI1000935.1 putative DNA-binding transcriptional regulator [Serratia liquefaciens]CAI1861627.1 putative DNA-binding transcriptional regulator [Serratia liquefaciens]CAI2026776.1 putative DNA-binding transcriptional regulator [Serratia liquefaciens]